MGRGGRRFRRTRATGMGARSRPRLVLPVFRSAFGSPKLTSCIADWAGRRGSDEKPAEIVLREAKHGRGNVSPPPALSLGAPLRDRNSK
ncbi:hypothetical protein GCM10011335_22390 [Aureimonas glaciei]|uniref:Uncharacterized protein n=1 Tax=Aureimonas glaciei TaxID=1776957 RepID=A0A916XY63_9HYPH|nr:hypothetical protein GCM10011335_22390 [Aureimonas glaciei]